MNSLYWFCVGATAVAAGFILALAYLEWPTKAERERADAALRRAENSVPSRLDVADGLPIDPRRWRS